MKSGLQAKLRKDFKTVTSDSNRMIQSDFQTDFKLQSMNKHSNKMMPKCARSTLVYRNLLPELWTAGVI